MVIFGRRVSGEVTNAQHALRMNVTCDFNSIRLRASARVANDISIGLHPGHRQVGYDPSDNVVAEPGFTGRDLALTTSIDSVSCRILSRRH